MTDADPVYPPGSTPPKSTTRIRQSLKAIHGANPSRPAGPLRRGLSKENWIAVDSLGEPRYYLSLLAQHQIESRTRTRRGKTSVLVQIADLSLARQLLERVPGEMRRGQPRRPRLQRQVILVRSTTSMLGGGQVGMGFGTMLGFSTGIPINRPEWTFVGAFVGFVAGVLWAVIAKRSR